MSVSSISFSATVDPLVVAAVGPLVGSFVFVGLVDGKEVVLKFPWCDSSALLVENTGNSLGESGPEVGIDVVVVVADAVVDP